MRITTLLLCLGLLAVGPAISQERHTPFQPDSALAYLKVLSTDIGPRPMGSPAEQAAMQYAVSKFQEFGLDEAYVLPFRIAPAGRLSGTNTTSGTAVGVLRGRTERTIVIGAHIDSYSPEGPGANDDGSGSAVVLELARSMSQKEWESTLVFCLFGGEESGLKGSYHFVSAYSDLGNVALMLQVDMANGTDWLLPLFEADTVSAPEWLVGASYEEFDKLGYDGLRYPFHFYSLNNSVGGASSDHEPFLRAGIPAIDFTTDVSDPIHTQQDSFGQFTPGGLERSGDLVYRLTERFDAGVPQEPAGRYVTVQIGRSIYLIPMWLVWAFILLSFALTIWTLRELRTARTEKRGENWTRVPGLKVLMLTALVAVVTVFFEDVLSLLSGWRTPWYGDPSAMIPVAVMTAMFMSAVAARLAGRLNLSTDAYRYGLRSVVTLVVYTILLALVSPRLALYPAIGMFFVSLAFMSSRGILSVALIVLGAYPMVRLVLSEPYHFVARMFAQIPPGASSIIAGIFLVLLATVILVPFALALTGILKSSSRKWPSVAIPLRQPAWLGILAAGTIIFSAIVLSEPPYSDRWTQKIEVTQELSSGDSLLHATVKSTDHLDGTTISMAEFDTTIASRETTVRLPDLPASQEAWMHTGLSQPEPGGRSSLLTVRSRTRPYTLEVRFTPKHHADGSRIIKASAGLSSVALQDGIASVRFYSFPDTSIVLPITLALNRPDTVEQVVVATFAEPAIPVTVTKEHSSVIYRTIVQETREFYVGRIEED